MPSEECLWWHGQDNYLAMSGSHYVIGFRSLSSTLGSPPEVKQVYCVFKLAAEPVEICCSDGEVVVLLGKSAQAAQLFFPLHSGGWVGFNAKGRRKEAICDYLEETQKRPKPAVTDVVKCDAGGLCCTYPCYKFRRTEVCSYIYYFPPHKFSFLLLQFKKNPKPNPKTSNKIILRGQN